MDTATWRQLRPFSETPTHRSERKQLPRVFLRHNGQRGRLLLRMRVFFFFYACHFLVFHARKCELCAALCVFWWNMRCFMRVFWWNMHDFMRLCRVLVVAFSAGIVHGTLFVTHFFLSVTHRHEVVIYRTQNTADTDIRPSPKFKRANYEHKRHDYTSHAT